MGQVLHGSARTTAAIQHSIRRIQESLQTLATRHNLNPKTAIKWRKRPSTADAPMGPKPASTVFTAALIGSHGTNQTITRIIYHDIQGTKMPWTLVTAKKHCYLLVNLPGWPKQLLPKYGVNHLHP
jgi:hypothetical protein